MAVATITTPQRTKKGTRESIVSDDRTQQVLKEILMELKKINIQMALITDTLITDNINQ